MPLELPSIDDRKYQDILAEAMARIRVHNPEWNNYNDSDPGITLLQLFAFMSESLLYRANLIPERNRVKFLSLLGIPLQAAAAASGLVTISNVKAPVKTLTLPADQELRAGKLPFRSQDAIDVLPVEAALYVKRMSAQDDARMRAYWETLYAGQAEVGQLQFYETVPVAAPEDPANLPTLDLGDAASIDRGVWIALLARDADGIKSARTELGGRQLNLGMYPAPDCDPFCEVPAGDRQADLQDLPLVFEIASGSLTADGRPKYLPLQASIDDDLLKRPGIARLTLPGADKIGVWEYTDPLTAGTGDYPPLLDDPKVQARLVTWLRVRLARETAGSGMQARFHWLGVNCVRVSQRARARSETLGRGNGEPDQAFRLVNTPVLADSVRLTVNGEAWTRIDDLLRAPPEVTVHDPRQPPGGNPTLNGEPRVFTVDRESGVIRFGDGIHGARVPRDAVIRASYDYGGGAAGNVNIGAINKATVLPAGYQIGNPLPTWGGAEAESVADAERNIPRYLQHQDRLVTGQDFTDIARRTPGVDIGRVELLPLFDPRLGQDGVPGMATLLIVPAADALHPDFPQPDQRMLQQVCTHLAPRRLITTELHVRGPEYVPLVISIGIEIAPGHDVPTVREAVNSGLRGFLSPLTGGRDGSGWPLAKSVVQRELWAEATRIAGVSYVNELLLGDANGLEREEISIRGLMLPELLMIETRQGAAATLADVIGEGVGATAGGAMGGSGPLGSGGDGLGDGGDGAGAGDTVVPVPVIPDEC